MSSVCDMQRRMVHFCKTGDDVASTGMQENRAFLYRELISSNIQSTLNNYYPLTMALLGEEKWKEFTTDFFAHFPCQDPKFWKMPKGLVEFAKTSKWKEVYQIPFLADLLDFEWLEIEIYMMKDALLESYTSSGNVLEEVPYVNPEHRIATYDYPVAEQINLRKPFKKGRYFVFGFRHQQTLAPHFFSISVFFKTLIEVLCQKKLTGKEALELAAEMTNVPVNERLFEIGSQFMKDLIKKGAILGFLK